LILFLTLLFGTIKISYAGWEVQKVLTVYVIDSNRNPIEGATVTVTPDGGSKTTDAEGKATFLLFHGTYMVRIEKTGYKTVETDVEIPLSGDVEIRIQLVKEGESGEGGVVFVTGAICGLDGWDDIADIWVNVPDFWSDPVGAIVYGGVNAILWVTNNIIEIIFDIFKMLFGWFRNIFMGLANLLQGWGIAAPFALAISFMVIFGVLAIFFRILWWIYDKIPII